MRTKTMFAVLAASACAFAADFPTDQNAIITEPGTYTATGNLGWTSLAVGGAGSFLFDLSGGPYTVTLTGTGNNVMTLNAKDTDLTLKGGAWTFAGAAPNFNCASGTRGANRSLTLDGAKMSGLSNFYLAYGSDPNSSLVLTNEAELSVGAFYLSQNSANAKGLRLDIVGGSKLTTTGAFGTDGGNGASDQDAWIRVSGSGSQLKVGNTFTFGNGHRGLHMEVADGATVDMGNKNFTMSSGRYAADAHLLVTGTGTVFTNCAYFTVGSNSSTTLEEATYDNTVLVSDGAGFHVTTLRLGHDTNGSTNNTFIVSNATFAATGLTIKGANGKYNNLEFRGSASKIRTGNNWKYLSQGGASFNRFTIDGSTWTAGYAFSTYTGTNNVMEIVNGALADLSSNTFTLGHDQNEKNYHGDRLTIGANAELRTSRFLMAGNGQELIISNGTLTALTSGEGSWANGAMIFANNRAYATNLVVTLRGTTPKIASSGFLVVQSNTKFRFEMPAGGYAEDFTPITGSRVRFDMGQDARPYGEPVFEVDVSELMPTLTGKKKYKLVEGVEKGYMGTIIARSNAIAPEGCTFSYEDDSVYLTVKPKQGLILIFR